MFCIKPEGEVTSDICDLLAKKLQQEFQHQLPINREFSNTGAWVEIGEHIFPNVTYSFGAKSVKLVTEGFQLFLDELQQNLKPNQEISIRHPIEINQHGEQIVFYTRCAILNRHN